MFDEQLTYALRRLDDAATNGTDVDAAYWRGRVDAIRSAKAHADLLSKALRNALNCLGECDRFCAHAYTNPDCDAECYECENACACASCRELSSFLWNGTDGSRGGTGK